MRPDVITDLPTHDHAGRRDRLRAAMADVNLDGLYVTGAANLAWLTGFTGSNGQVLISPDPSQDLLFTDARYEGRAATHAPGLLAVITREADTVVLERFDGRLGFEAEHVTHQRARDLLAAAEEQGRTLEPTTDLVEHLRVVKEPSEITRLRLACQITVTAFHAMLESLQPGRTERALAVELERRFVDLGADGLAFPPIVASGPNGAIPHHQPTHRAIEHGDLITFDIGALVDGYHADFTRTVAVGTPPDGWAEIHALVEHAQAAGMTAATSGRPIADVDQAARHIIADAGHGDAFVHGTGHGVGLQIHEAPMVSARATGSLPASTVITVEPGVYLADHAARPPGTPPGGVRIEDTVLVTPNGSAEPLTDAPRALIVLPA